MNCQICESRTIYSGFPDPCPNCKPKYKSASIENKYQSSEIETRTIHGVSYFALKDTPIPIDNKYYTPMKSASTEQKRDPAWITMAKQSGLLPNKVSSYLALTEGVYDIKQPIKSASKKQEKPYYISIMERFENVY